MLGMIPFVKAAGKAVGRIFKGKAAEETLKKEVEGYGLNTDGVDIKVDDEGIVTVAGEAVSQEVKEKIILAVGNVEGCLLYTSPSPRDRQKSRMPSSA